MQVLVRDSRRVRPSTAITPLKYLALYPEEGSIAETSVRLDFLNNSVIITIFNFTMTKFAARDFLSL